MIRHDHPTEIFRISQACGTLQVMAHNAGERHFLKPGDPFECCNRDEIDSILFGSIFLPGVSGSPPAFLFHEPRLQRMRLTVCQQVTRISVGGRHAGDLFGTCFRPDIKESPAWRPPTVDFFLVQMDNARPRRYRLWVYNKNVNYAPVAQLDRVSGYEPEGREFESLRARHQ